MNKKELSLANLIEGFRLSCQAEGKSPRTIDWYHTFLLQFEQHMSANGLSASVAHITRHHIRDYIAYLQTVPNRKDGDKRLSAATVQGHVRTLKAFFSWLRQEEYVDNNVMERVPIPKAPIKVVDTFTHEALVRLTQCCANSDGNGQRDLLILFLLLDTGVRVSELVNIKLSEVDLEEGYIKITRGKGSRERLVPMGSLVKKYLWKYLSHGRPEPATHQIDNLFLSRHGLQLQKNGVQQMLRRWGRRAELTGVRVSPHTFRHTFAKNYLLNGGDIFSLQKILGHSSLASVRLYLNLFAIDVKEQHRKFSPVDNLAASPDFASPRTLR